MTDRELLQLSRDAMTSLDGVGSVIQWRGQWEKVHAAMAAIDAAMSIRQVAHSSQAQGELSVGPVVTNNGGMNEENQNG